MTDRIAETSVYRLQPELARALGSLGDSALASGLEEGLIELVRLRASQINGCAYCIAMHNRDARGRGEHQGRLDLLPVWREAPCFSAREGAALAWTEAMTRLPDEGVPDRVYRGAKDHFSDAELVNLTSAVIAINGWNRVCVAFRIVPTVAPA